MKVGRLRTFRPSSSSRQTLTSASLPKTLCQIRGAPALASLAALSLSLSLATALARTPPPAFLSTPESFLAHLEQTTSYLNSARPTAVNLGEAMGRMNACGKEAVARGADLLDAVKAVVEAGKEVRQSNLLADPLTLASSSDFLSTPVPYIRSRTRTSLETSSCRSTEPTGSQRSPARRPT